MDGHMDYFFFISFLCVFVSVNHLISFMENRSLENRSFLIIEFYMLNSKSKFVDISTSLNYDRHELK